MAADDRFTQDFRETGEDEVLGTRSEIAIATRRHRRHGAFLVLHGKSRIVIDCGAGWSHKFEVFEPTANLVTHAHPDHARGLANGAHCPVYKAFANGLHER